MLLMLIHFLRVPYTLTELMLNSARMRLAALNRRLDFSVSLVLAPTLSDYLGYLCLTL